MRKPFEKYPEGEAVYAYVDDSGSQKPIDELKKLTRGDSESLNFMLSSISEFTEYRFSEVRQGRWSPFYGHDFNLEIKPQKSCPKQLRIATLGIPQGNFERLILLHTFITHAGAGNNVPLHDIEVSDKRARECLEWITENEGAEW